MPAERVGQRGRPVVAERVVGEFQLLQPVAGERRQRPHGGAVHPEPGQCQPGDPPRGPAPGHPVEHLAEPPAGEPVVCRDPQGHPLRGGRPHDLRLREPELEPVPVGRVQGEREPALRLEGVPLEPARGQRREVRRADDRGRAVGRQLGRAPAGLGEPGEVPGTAQRGCRRVADLPARDLQLGQLGEPARPAECGEGLIIHRPADQREPPQPAQARRTRQRRRARRADPRVRE